jgi:hypothetical protein
LLSSLNFEPKRSNIIHDHRHNSRNRPEIIKMVPVIRECERRRLDYFALHTGQHYSYQMDTIFFDPLELPASL